MNGTLSNYAFLPNFRDDRDEERKPCIQLYRFENGKSHIMWKQVFSDWLQRDATYNRLYQRRESWDGWGAIFVRRGAGALTREIAPFYVEMDDIYPSGAAPADDDRMCMWVARGDEDNPLLFMVEMNSGQVTKIAELYFSTLAQRGWAHCWLTEQLNRSATFFRILEEDGERGLQEFVSLVVGHFGPEHS